MASRAEISAGELRPRIVVEGFNVGEIVAALAGLDTDQADLRERAWSMSVLNRRALMW